MTNRIISDYFQNKAIPKEQRMQVYDDLHSGKVSEEKLAQALKKTVLASSPAVSAALPFAEKFMGSEQGQELEATKAKARDVGVDINAKRDELIQKREVEDRGFIDKVKNIPSAAMEGAEEGIIQRDRIKAQQAELEAKGEDFGTRLSNIDPSEYPLAQQPAAWNAKITGWIKDKVDDLGTEALPYSKPIIAALYDQFVDPAIESVLEAEFIPTGKPGDWVQSPKSIGSDIASVAGALSPEYVDEGLKDVGADVSTFIKENPDVALEIERTGATLDLARPIIDVLLTKGLLKSLPEILKVTGAGAKEVGAAGIEAFGPAVKKTGEIAKSTLTKTVEVITKPRFVATRNKTAESMMNSLVKVDPARGAEHFYKLSKGQTMGNFLLERDIIGTPEQVVEQLGARFSKVKEAFDSTISSIEGKYKFKVADDILEEMAGRFERTLDKKNLKRVKQLRAKYDGEGLTMAENLEMKRLYESKVKTGYLKDNNSELVDRATNLDNELRRDFIDEAEASGFGNASDLSKEIQLTRAAMDSIESKAIRKLVNNQFSLTDNLLLVGGAINPSSLAVLGIKKITGTPAIQAKIIRALVTNDIKIMKEIPGLPLEVISTQNAAKRQILFEKWLEESGLKGVAEGTEPLKLPAGETIQAGPAGDILESRSQQFREGSGVFDNQRSVNESTIPKTSITKNSNIDDSIPAFNKGVNPPTKSLTAEAKKYKSAEEFYNHYMGSATQYNEYTPELRLGGTEGGVKITELGIDPEETVTIYRGIDDVTGKIKKQINDGDFVTTDFDSAASYSGAENVVSKEVKAKDLILEDEADYFKEDPFFIGAEYIYTTKYDAPKPLSKSQLTDIWNQARVGADSSVLAKRIVASGGSTNKIIDNVKVKEGIAFSPVKNTERVVPIQKLGITEIKPHIDKYADDFKDVLSKEGNVLGAWMEKGDLYLDISNVSTDPVTAIGNARASNQKAIYDLASGQTFRLNTMSDEAIIEAIKKSDGGKVAMSGKYADELGDLSKIEIKETGTNSYIESQKTKFNALSKEQKARFVRFKKKTAGVYEEFKDDILEIGSRNNVEVSDPSFMRKSDGRSLDKMFEETELGDIVWDMNRGAYLIKETRDFNKVIKEIKEAFDVVRVKNRIGNPTSDGYRDILVNVRTSNGTLAEVQFIPERIAKVKDKLHPLYEKKRDVLTSERVKTLLEKEMKKKYDEAWSKTSAMFSDLNVSDLIN